MRKFWICLIVLFTVTIGLFLGCSQNTQLEKAEAFYCEYADLLFDDVENALTNYVHYEDPEDLKIALGSTGLKTLSYEILYTKELNEKLWVINVWKTTNFEPQGHGFYNFVAEIDGKLYVITSPEDIPPSLKGDIDFTPYDCVYYPDEISYIDIVTD